MITQRRSRPSKHPRSKLGRGMRIALELTAVLVAILLVVLTLDSGRESSDRASASKAVSPREATRARPAATPLASDPDPEAARVAKKADVRQKMASMPLRFEHNAGQFGDGVHYIARAEGLTLALTDDGPRLRLGGRPMRRAPTSDEVGAGAEHARAAESPEFEPVHELHMRVQGASSRPKLEASEELETKSNYFIGNDSSRWRTNVSNYGRVTYREILPGTDLVYRGDGSKLEYDFVVAPGSSPDAIAVTYEGADAVSTNDAGELEVALAGTTLVQRKPVIYQEIDGQRRRVDGAFRLLGGVTAGFEIADYDRTQPLVIDPVVEYATYLGTSSYEGAFDIAFDSASRAIVTGPTQSISFPMQSPYDSVNHSASYMDAFVSKFNQAGTALVYSTYLGGTGDDTGYSIAVDSTDALVVVGKTSSADFPTANAAQSTRGGSEEDEDGFVAKLQADGSALVFSTYQGGSGLDHLVEGAVDASGNVYAVGYSQSANFPVTSGVVQTTHGGGNDGVIAKFAPHGARIFATYFGQIGSEWFFGVTARSNGNAVVIGLTNGSITTTPGAYATAKPGGADLVVVEFNAAGTSLAFSTYFGGSGVEGQFGSTLGVALDGNGDIYGAGFTTNASAPTTVGAYRTTGAGLQDGVLFKLSANGASLLYSTYIGGSAWDSLGDVTVDASGRVYVVGRTLSSNYPLVDAAQISPGFTGAAIISVFNPSGTALVYSSYFSGNGADERNDSGYAIALAPNGRFGVATMCTGSAPTTAGVLRTTYAGQNDACIMVVALLSVSPSASRVVVGDTLNFSTVGSSETFTWNVSPNNSGASITPAGVYTAGSVFDVTDTVTATNTETSETVTATVQVFDTLKIAPTNPSVVTGTTQTFTASGGTGGNTFILLTNSSGATINGSTGLYTAGPTINVTDTVRVLDNTGHRANATVAVTSADACPDDPAKTQPGTCGCGVSDANSDTDEWLNCQEDCDDDPKKRVPGECGCGVPDDDTDSDQTLDCDEECDEDPNKTLPGECGCGVADDDSDSDQTLDCDEECDEDSLKTLPGLCGCGVEDTDTDLDVTPDCTDLCAEDPLKIAPGECGCGTADTDTDTDDTPDCEDGCDEDPLKTSVGLCGCGTADTDTDTDNTPDCQDACDDDPLKTAPGLCGCGIEDADSDSDETPNCDDLCPDDADKVDPGTCGCGIADIDSDVDTVFDCEDQCRGDDLSGDADADGICNDLDHRPIVLSTQLESDQGPCSFGGVEIVVGLDENANGELEEPEVTGISYACSGDDGTSFAFASTVLDPSLERCVTGGVELRYGVDNDDDRTLDSEEVDATHTLCAGMNSLANVSVVTPSPLTCPSGGARVEVGRDSNGNLTLDSLEVRATQLVCRASPTISRSSSLEPDPLVCPNGGERVELGVDENGDGVLANGEVDSTSNLCDGSTTRASTTELLPDAAVCPNGGARLSFGLDADGDGALDAEEVSSTQDVCHGLDTLMSATAIEADPVGCPSGGVRLAVGLNDDGDATLDAGEVDFTEDICHGLRSLARVTELLPDPAGCPAGGALFEVGLDDDGDATLDVEELDASARICDGLTSLTTATELEPDPAVCPNGGVRVQVGLDDDGDGTLAPQEVNATEDVCDAQNSRTRTTELLRGSEVCSHGGARIDTGIDADGDGFLSDAEVTSSANLCNALDNVTSVTELSADPAYCTQGGALVARGLDVDGDGVLDAGEVQSSRLLCHGKDSLTTTTLLESGSEVCPNGGARIDSGLDFDGSGILDPKEITSSEDLCHGEDSLTRTTLLEPEAEVCPNGGARIDTGLDLDGDKFLDDSEITSSEDLCHGEDSLTRTTDLEPSPEVCPDGGARIDTGLDLDGDNYLDDAEITSTEDLCHGLDSLSVTTELEPDPAVCPRGGTRVDTGLDLDGDRELDAGEIRSTDDICHGITSLVTNTPLSPDAAVCPLGGARIDVGLDDDGDGVLEGGEIEGTATICSSTNALVATTPLEPDPAVCPNGGTQVDVGIDDDGDSVLDAGEIAATESICHGLDSHIDVRTTDPGVPPLDEGPWCPTGGVEVFSGSDDDGSGTLDPIEVNAYQLVCNGMDTIVSTTELEPSPDPCPQGGTQTIAGKDGNDNGMLENAEVSSSQILCNGLHGSVRTVTVEPDPETCPFGGLDVDSGLDEDGSGELDDEEVTSTQRVCTGLGTLVETMLLEPDAEFCSEGGTLVAAGIDSDGDGSLNSEEITASQRICHGLGGLIETEVLQPDADGCRAGGIRVRTGIDADGDGMLDEGEGSEWRDICHGEEWLVRIDTIASGAICSTGGMRVQFGYDGDADGKLSDPEIASTQLVCHGRTALARATRVEPSPELCAAGGTRLESGVDDDGDGTLDPGEVDFEQVLCDGTDSVVRTSTLPMGSEECPKGGKLVEAGTDLNDNGELDGSEVDSSRPVCGGADALLETERLPAGDECESGGLLVNAGRDDGDPGGVAADGELQPEEIDRSYTLCDDVVVTGGSGDCSLQRPGSGGTNTLGWIALALGIALVRRRRRVLALLACLLLADVASSASAQGRFDVEAADVVPGPDGSIVNVYGARTYEPGKYSLGVLGSYARKPLSIESDNGTHLGDLVGSVGTLQFLGAFGVFDRVDLGVAIPLHRVSAGSSFEAAPPPSVRAATLNDSEIALGDIRLAPRYSVYQHAGRSGMDFAVVGQLWLPTGSDSAYAGESVRFEPRLALDYHSDTLLVAFNAGYHIRGASRILSTELDDQLRVGAGADLGVGKGFSLLGEVGMHVNVLADEFGGDDLASEALVGVRYRTTGWVAQLGAGPGLFRGLSAPLYRVLASIGWSSEKAPEPILESEPLELDTDQDGLLDSADRCVSDPEDRDGYQDEDGCSDPDNDSDAVVDVSDGCPVQPEDRDAFQDLDGCPDPDNDQDAILDVDDRCPNDPGVPEAAGCAAPPPAPEPPAAVVVTDDRIELKETVLFGNDNAQIQEQSQALIDEIAQLLRGHAEIELVIVEGHTDDRGKKAHNQKLSEARANSVRVALIQRGIDPARLSAEGFGMTRPIVPNVSDDNRAKNRRVELRIGRRAQR